VNLREAFKAPLHAVKFRDAPKVADEINQWVSENTRGRIAKAVSPEDFKSRSGPGVIEEPALVTMNAVYFKADWASKFIKSSTLPRSFQLDASSSKNTLMMHQNSLQPYSENAQLKFLELPYVDSRFSLYILLPKEILAVPRLMDLVSAEVVAGLKREACVHQVDVLFPKFEMVSHENVKSALAGMGVTSAFNRDKANFDRMITKRFEADRIYLSEVFSDAWIEVHEEGTRAAAATTTTHFSAGCSQAPRPRPVNFHADHPFLFFIVHNQSRSILFAGWMAKPPA
jgi:serpin B